MVWLTGLFSLLGNGISSFFGWKGEQAKTVQNALEVVKSINDSDSAAITATANALQVILTQGSWLERNWRSWLMVGIIIIIFSSFFGYVPPYFNGPISPMMERFFGLLEIGLGGYIIRRGIVDVVRIFNIGSILRTLIEKKIV